MKKQIISGLVGVAALMLATASFAASTICTSGTLTAVGSGDLDAATKVGAADIYNIRWIDVTCTSDTTLSGRYYFHKTTDPDGKAAAALTALSDGKTVSYSLYIGNPTNTYIVGFSVNSN